MPRKYVYALAETLVRVNSIGVHLHTGEVWNNDDPVVQTYPDLFGDTPPVVRKYPGWVPPVEKMTAEPGERRQTRRAD